MSRSAHARASACVALGALVACGRFGAADDATPASADAGALDGEANGDGGGPSTNDGGPDAASAAKTVVAVSPLPIPIIAVNGTRIMWTTTEPEGGAIHDLYSCPKTGCVGTTPLDVASPVSTIATDGITMVVGYSSQSRGLVRFDNDALSTLVPGTNRIYQSTVRDGSAWYVVYEEEAAGTRTLHRVPIQGGPSESIGTYAPASGVNASHVVVGKTRAFFASHSTGNIGYCALDKTGCGELATGNSAFAYALATDDAKVFWANADTVMSCNVDATPPCNPQPELPLTVGAAWTIIAYKGSLFMTMKSGAVIECAANDCANEHKTLIQDEPFDGTWSYLTNNVAVDDDAVYYVTHVGNEYRLVRLERPKQ